MNTTSKNHPVYAYIIDQLLPASEILSQYDEVVEDTIQARLQWVVKTFESESGGKYANHFCGWLQGLPSAFSVDFMNYRILELAVEWGSLPQNATEKQADKIIENWFNFITTKFATLCRRNGVKCF